MDIVISLLQQLTVSSIGRGLDFDVVWTFKINKVNQMLNYLLCDSTMRYE
jgi:hypothetical protein